jgi:hypothetical protein
LLPSHQKYNEDKRNGRVPFESYSSVHHESFLSERLRIRIHSFDHKVVFHVAFDAGDQHRYPKASQKEMRRYGLCIE